MEDKSASLFHNPNAEYIDFKNRMLNVKTAELNLIWGRLKNIHTALEINRNRQNIKEITFDITALDSSSMLYSDNLNKLYEILGNKKEDYERNCNRLLSLMDEVRTARHHRVFGFLYYEDLDYKNPDETFLKS